MDPAQAIDVAKDLGSGSPQMILAFVAVGATGAAAILGRMLYRSWQAHLAEVKACSAERTDLLTRNIEAQNRQTTAMEGLEQVVRAALDVVKGR